MSPELKVYWRENDYILTVRVRLASSSRLFPCLGHCSLPAGLKLYALESELQIGMEA